MPSALATYSPERVARRRCLPARARRSHAMHGGEHDAAGGVEVGPPGRVHGQWSCAWARAQPAADRLALHQS